MAASSSGDKTEKPTPKRREKARQDGQIPRTTDLGGWLAVLAATWLLPVLLRRALEQLGQMVHAVAEVPSRGIDQLPGFLGDAVIRGAMVSAPMVLVALLIGVGSQLAQIGWAPRKPKPNIKKLNPLSGIKQVFGMRSAWETAKNLLKLTLVVALGVGPVQLVHEQLTAGAGMSVPSAAAVIGGSALTYLRTAVGAGLVLAAVDYWQNRKQVDKQIKMTKQEVKEEHKQQDGDPMVKGQIRQRQMAMSRNRMMAELPSADVVVVNPTHIAVALRYDVLVGTPVVIAKGAGAIADRIREVAGESAIPIVRDVPLARTLHRFVEVGEPVPAELYEAIARVLAFVFALRSRGRASGTHDSPFGDVHAPLEDLARPAPRRRRQMADR